VIEDFGLLAAPQWPEIESTWATKLRGNSTRVLMYLRAWSGKKITD